ncbi:MAG: MATE family efflux transporter [Lachnospiraceae bacterium]|nr:MATE family efflux transporter [Lachnospiraceae bacterium]
MAVAVPIMIQNGITNFVGMLDNIMVGRVGTDAMSGVSIVNQLFFVFTLCLFGATAGIGIFTAQFAGKGDRDGIRYTMRMKLMVSVVLVVIGMIVFTSSGTGLIRLWLQGDSGTGDLTETLLAGERYLKVLMFEMAPLALAMSYTGTLRETGETILPMKAGILAVLVNLAGNYILIYGKLGAPALGVTGAALATVISRYVEAAFVIIWTHTHASINPFITGLFRSFYIPGDLIGKMALKAFPLLLNETLWSGGQTVLSQQYSLMGLDVVAAMNISNTVNNVFNIVFIAMGDAIAIILGQELGKKKTDRGGLLEKAHQLSFFTILVCLMSGALLFLVSSAFPRIYNTSDTIREIATGLIRVCAVFMPLYAYENSSYFTLRSGGKTWITFVFDSMFVWVVSIPAVFLLIKTTSLTILPLFTCVQLLELIKCGIGFALVNKGIWINDLTKYSS